MARIEIRDSYTSVDRDAWDALVAGGSPFLEHTYLAGLETLGCAVPETGWWPAPVLVFDDNDQLVAAAPAWITNHSRGEFVYDHGWADAALQNKIPYYPKVVVGVPFTPVSGQRLLVRAGEDRAVWQPVLTQALSKLLDGHAAGLHVLFNTEAEAAELSAQGAFTRTQYQFHWKNNGYRSFSDFIDEFPSKKRNKLRRERRDVQHLRFERKLNPNEAETAALHAFYMNTCDQFGRWGSRYLNVAFFQYLREHWHDRVHAVLAYDGDTLVAGCWNVQKGDRLYGRTWGSTSGADFLHFECCYYQAIEACIEHGWGVFEPGHGGGHKYKRGFEPTLTYSNHLLAHRGLHDALERHTAQEREAVDAQVAQLRSALPLKRLQQP